jgi:hypothetical protein
MDTVNGRWPVPADFWTCAFHLTTHTHLTCRMAVERGGGSTLGVPRAPEFGPCDEGRCRSNPVTIVRLEHTGLDIWNHHNGRSRLESWGPWANTQEDSGISRWFQIASRKEGDSQGKRFSRIYR